MSKADKYPEVRPVIVRWVDSIASSGWRDAPESKTECVSVGNLIKRDTNGVVLAMNSSHYGAGDYMTIPACAIRSVKKLKE